MKKFARKVLSVSLVIGCVYVVWTVVWTEAWRRLIPFPGQVDRGQLEMKLVRTRCFGTCPAYSMVVLGDGTVRYCGRAQVKITGAHTAHIPPEAVTDLLEDFRRAHFMAARSEYVLHVTDLPTYVLTLKIGNREKTVVDYGGERAGMPLAITTLEEQFDDLAGTERWVKGNAETTSNLTNETFAQCSTSALTADD